MSSSIDKQFGNLYIFGEHNDGYVDVSWSATQDTIVTHVKREEAENLMKAWNTLLNKTEELDEYKWKYEELSK